MNTLLDKLYYHLGLPATVYAVILFTVSSSAWSADTTIENGETYSGQPQLNSGETVTINAGGTLVTPCCVLNIYSSNASNITLVNNGTITMANNGGYGLYATGASGTATITNAGTITSTGSGIYFRVSSGTRNITNSGTITGTYQNYGPIILYQNSGTTTMTNSGTLTSSGANGYGFSSLDSSGTTTLTNSGTIQVTGSGAVGVKSNSAITITNSGTISATSSASKAIETSGSYNDTLNIKPGSVITGTVDLGDGTDVINVTATDSESNLTVSGSALQWNLSTAGIVSANALTLGSSQTVTHSGTFSTTVASGYGMYLNSSANAALTNSGGITTSGANSYGIYANASSGTSTFTNSGTITTSGSSGYGIYSNLNSGTETITNSGTITASGSSGMGINSYANSGTSTITSSGTITTTGQYGHGMYSYNQASGGTSTITNSGTITTSEQDSMGIYSVSNSGTTNITNSGTITTSGSSGSQGITSNGNSGTANITNSGTITTSGQYSHGMYSYANTGTETFTNSGTITTSGSNAAGIFSQSNSGTETFTNSGTITTSDSNGYGIYSYGNSGTEAFTNSSTITTSGDSADGIFLASNSGTTTITNSGTIKVTGSDAVGVTLDGGVTLNNSGTISATGSATQAIDSTGTGNDTLNLLSGSKITGTIDLGDGTDTVNISGTEIINGCATASCMSSSMTFTGAENINVSAPNAIHVANNGVVATVDPTGNSVLGVSLSTMTSAVHDVVSQRMARTRASGIPATSSESVSSWMQAIGAHRSRGTEGSAMGHNHSYVGFTGGMETKVKDGRFGLIAGYASSSVSTKKMSNSTNSNSFFGGIYGDVPLGRQISLTTSLLVGYEYHDNSRKVRNNVVGVESAKSDFSSVFFSPSMTLSSAHPFKIVGRPFEFRPSTTAVYTIARYDDYQEKGTTGANLVVENRTVQAVNVSAQLAVATQINKHSELELRSGFVTRHTDHDKITASLGGNRFQFAGAGDNSVQGGFVGGSLRYHATDNLRAVVDVKYRGAGGRESEFIGRAGISYSF